MQEFNIILTTRCSKLRDCLKSLTLPTADFHIATSQDYRQRWEFCSGMQRLLPK